MTSETLIRFHHNNMIVRTLLVKWLSDPAVLQYYEGRDRAHDLELVKKHYYENRDAITQCIVQFDNLDIGYVQFYPISDEERIEYGYGNVHEIIYGMDQFIGEVDYWNRGIGTMLVSRVIEYIHGFGVRIVVMDPQVWNLNMESN